jgi:small subunit ribosomal protein S8
MLTDPVADMLTRIRNGIRAGKGEVLVRPHSKFKVDILRAMEREGFIEGFEETPDSKGGEISVKIKYFESSPVITDLERISKPGRRIYVGSQDIPRVKSGLGVAILSTSMGVLSDREARKKNIGGEVLLYLW